MAKAKNKTVGTDGDVDTFIGGIADDTKREDSQVLLELMGEVTGAPPKMWGASIVGFGDRHMVYDSGREVEWFLVGFSPRKQNLTMYIMDGFDNYDDLLGQLGKHTTGKSCLYVKRLEQVDMDVLTQLVTESVQSMKDA